MAEKPTMPPNSVFEASVLKLCQLNELASFLNPWIITPPASPMAAGFHPSTTVILYAIMEQGLTFAFYHMAIQPWIILLWAGPFHLYYSGLTIDLLQAHCHTQSRSLFNAADSKDEKSRPKGQDPFSGFWLLQPLLTAALNNGTLVLFAQTLQSPSRLEQHPNVRILEMFSIVLFLGCRFADLDIWRRTRRGGSWNEWRSLLVPLYCQVILLSVRASLRWVVGFSPLLGIQMMSYVEAEENFGLQRYQWIKEMNLPKLPPWVLWASPVLVFVLTLSGRLLLNRSLKGNL